MGREVTQQRRDVVLTFTTGPLSGHTVELYSRESVLLGRDPECDVALGDERVSRRHCLISLDDSAAFVKDLGSANGIWVNGQPSRLAPLASGDVLRLGETAIRVEIADTERTVRITPRPVDPLAAPEATNSRLRVAVAGYALGRCLGEGATSAVFTARGEDGQEVAVKVLRTAASLSEDDQLRFLREAEIAETLSHPNVVATLGHGRAGPHLYMILELVPGETIKTRLKRMGRIPVLEALGIARQIASALEYARTRDIVHRDVKPDNVIVGDDGVAKLLDFGLAKSTVDIGSLTRVGDVLGTLAYMSPEQLRDGIRADHRSDIYSLGATLHHMLAGSAPFEAKTNLLFFEKILEEPAPILAVRHPDVPPAVSALVLRCLRKDPDDRHQTAGELARALDALIARSAG
ncbi:MAG: protein kinase [Planctomycetota bacterium]